MDDADYRTLDDVLGLLRGQGPELRNGFTNHAPMVAEALCALGRPEAAVAWARMHANDAHARPPTVGPVALDDWESESGDVARWSDWAIALRAEIAETGWEVTLGRWCERLAPAFVSDAAHGVIRVGHAVRALSVDETDARLDELADGLALWVSTRQTLPTATKGDAPVLPAAEALARVPFVPPQARNNRGAITGALGALTHAEGFDSVIHLVDVAAPDAGLEVACAFGRMFLAQSQSPIVFTHAITGAATALRLSERVEHDTGRRLLAHAWQTGCALRSAYGESREPVEPPAEDVATIVDSAIAHGDAHVIKLSEACLFLHARTRDPVFLQVPSLARQTIAVDRMRASERP